MRQSCGCCWALEGIVDHHADIDTCNFYIGLWFKGDAYEYAVRMEHVPGTIHCRRAKSIIIWCIPVHQSRLTSASSSKKTDRVGTLGICSIPFFTTTNQEIFRSNRSNRSNALEMKLRHALISHFPFYLHRKQLGGPHRLVVFAEHAAIQVLS